VGLCCQTLLVLILSIVHIVLVTRDHQNAGESDLDSFEAALRSQPASLLLAIYAFMALWFVGGLCGFHVFLVCVGQTTNEKLKATFPRGSPHSHGCYYNFVTVFCTVPPPAKLKPRAPIKRLAEHELTSVLVEDGDSSQPDATGGLQSQPASMPRVTFLDSGQLRQLELDRMNRASKATDDSKSKAADPAPNPHSPAAASSAGGLMVIPASPPTAVHTDTARLEQREKERAVALTNGGVVHLHVESPPGTDDSPATVQASTSSSGPLAAHDDASAPVVHSEASVAGSPQ